MKKTLFVSDTCTTIKDTDKHPVTMEMTEKLDEMLNEYGVTHFFSLPIDSTDGIANNDEDYLTVFYSSEDMMALVTIKRQRSSTSCWTPYRIRASSLVTPMFP